MKILDVGSGFKKFDERAISIDSNPLCNPDVLHNLNTFPCSNNETSCPLCSGRLGRPMFRNVRDRFNVSQNSWTFFQCNKCGSASLSPMPSQEELLKYYPPIYSVDQISCTHWLHRVLYKLENYLFYEPIYRDSVKQVVEITGLHNGHLLDIGGGAGHRTALFREVGFEVTVLDTDERALKVARERFGLKTICGLLEEITLPDESFDIILFYHVLEHLPAPKRALQKACRLLRPNGWVVADVPLVDSYGAQLFKSRWAAATEAPRHVILPTREGMKHLFNASGLNLRGFASDSLLSNSGVWVFSLIPSTATPIACSNDSVAMRFFWRLTGALALIGCLPLAWLVGAGRRPDFGVFLAQKVQKPSNVQCCLTQ